MKKKAEKRASKRNNSIIICNLVRTYIEACLILYGACTMLNNGQKVQVSDTTSDETTIAADTQKKQ